MTMSAIPTPNETLRVRSGTYLASARTDSPTASPAKMKTPRYQYGSSLALYNVVHSASGSCSTQ